MNLKRARFGAVDVELVKVDLLTLTEMVVSITDIDHILPRRIKILQLVHKNSDLLIPQMFNHEYAVCPVAGEFRTIF